MKKMRLVLVVLVVVMMLAMLMGCGTQAANVSANLSKEADNFNVVRQLTVINCIQGDTIFQMTGKMSITKDNTDNQLEVLVEDSDGSYQKHFIGLSDNVTYTCVQKGFKNVSKYKFTLNYNPKMWIPIDVKTID